MSQHDYIAHYYDPELTLWVSGGGFSSKEEAKQFCAEHFSVYETEIHKYTEWRAKREAE